MKISRIFQLILVLLPMAAVPLSGQEGLVTEDRFVTLINPRYEEGTIILSFEPIEDPDLQYRVYRSDKPIISQADIEKATLIGEIRAEEVPLKDFPEIDGKFYYAVTVVEEFQDLIPYLNTTTTPIDFSPLPEVIDSFTTAVAEREDGTHVLKIQLIPAADEYTYNLYTGLSFITEVDDKEPEASISGSLGYFELSIEEDTPLFVAITALNRLGVENKTLIPDRNISTVPFILEGEEEETVVREPDTAPVQQPSAEPDMVPVQQPSAELKEPEEEEVEAVSTYDLIDQNLRDNFYTGNYKTALANFRSILSINNLSEQERGSASFYAGQCAHYLKDFEAAIRYFVMSKEAEDYKGMADAWIERSLSRVK